MFEETFLREISPLIINQGVGNGAGSLIHGTVSV